MDLNGPAEVPPSSYTGRQYVDSAGCVFVRAGYGSAVNWVPRVSRDKKQLCGYKPTFQSGEAVLDVAKSAPAPAPAPASEATAQPAPAAAPAAAPLRTVSPFTPATGAGTPMETIALTTEPPRVGRLAPAAAPATVAVAAQPAVAAPKPAAVPPAAAPASAPKLQTNYTSPYAVAGAPRYRNTTPLPASEPASATITSAETVDAASTACPAGTSTATRYTLSDGRRVVRCGPQVQNPAAFINAASVPGLVVASTPAQSGYVSPYARAPMFGGTGYAASAAAPVSGYAAPTAPMFGGTGYAASQADYAAQSPYQAVPEAVHVRLPGVAASTTLAPVVVATKTGPNGYRAAFDDGRLNPFRGPRSAMGDAEQGRVWTNEVPAELVTARTAEAKLLVPLAAPEGRVSTKSAPLTPPQPQASGARFVQVGTFGVPANAEAAKARLRAAGLPVASSSLRRGGKTLVVVLAGPFAAGQAAQALSASRAAGFADALLR